MARRSRKTEANREKERESQDEPIVDKSNAHGARGEILRGLVRSRVGHHYVPKGFPPLRSPRCLRTRASGLAVRASNERDLGTLSAGSSCLRTRSERLPTRQETVGPPLRFVPLRRAPPFPPRVDSVGVSRSTRRVRVSHRDSGPCDGRKRRMKVANALSTWNRARSPAELKHIIERRKGNQKGFPQ